MIDLRMVNPLKHGDKLTVTQPMRMTENGLEPEGDPWLSVTQPGEPYTYMVVDVREKD